MQIFSWRIILTCFFLFSLFIFVRLSLIPNNPSQYFKNSTIPVIMHQSSYRIMQVSSTFNSILPLFIVCGSPNISSDYLFSIVCMRIRTWILVSCYPPIFPHNFSSWMNCKLYIHYTNKIYIISFGIILRISSLFWFLWLWTKSWCTPERIQKTLEYIIWTILRSSSNIF